VPVGDVVGVADEGGGRQLPRRTRRLQEPQTGFVRQTVGLAGVDVFARPDKVFPGVAAAARAGQDVVEAALVRAQQHAGVLATVAVAFANGLGAELRALLRHAGEVHGDNDGRHANLAADGVDGVVVRTDRKGDPFVPGARRKAWSVERGA